MTNEPSGNSNHRVFFDVVGGRSKLLFRLALAAMVFGAIVAGNGDAGSWFFTTPAHGFIWPAAGRQNGSMSAAPDTWTTCTSGPIAPGDGTQGLAVIGPCTVSGGLYQYKDVNIYKDVAEGGDPNGGSLTFMDDTGIIDFWATGILVENHGAIVAGAPTNPFKSKLTIHLYGVEQANKYDGKGSACRSPVNADFPHCGIPEAIWNSNPDANPA